MTQISLLLLSKPLVDLDLLGVVFSGPLYLDLILYCVVLLWIFDN